MNRDDIIKMALEAGFNEFTGGLRDDGSQDTYLDCWPEQLERFFHMAQAAMIEQGYRKCAEGQRTTQFCGMVEKAVQEEREACAVLCDVLADVHEKMDQWGSYQTAEALSQAIRGRGQA